MKSRILSVSLLCLMFATAAKAAENLGGSLEFNSLPKAHFEFTGPIGERIQVNLDNWLLRAAG